MHTFLAFSSVIQKPIQTRWSIVPHDAWATPLTKLVAERDVCMEQAVNILWTIRSTKYGGKGSKFQLNHFVPLIRIPSVVGECTETQVVDDDSEEVLLDEQAGDI